MTAQFASGKMPSWKSQLLFSLSLVGIQILKIYEKSPWALEGFIYFCFCFKWNVNIFLSVFEFSNKIISDCKYSLSSA